MAAMAATSGEPPPSGIALAFGKDAQQQVDHLRRWADWTREPGRMLLLIPPFLRGGCDVPVPWEARTADPLAGGDAELVRVLARERQHELRGELTSVERAGGQIITGSWRRHPSAGLLVVTTLPLWSLLVLDHRAALRTWLDHLAAEAGSPRALEEPRSEAALRPSSDDWTLLLHLCTGPYGDGRTALETLAASAVFRIGTDAATRALGRAQSAGWAKGGALTDTGRQLLAAGPYALHARDLTRMSHG